MNLKNIALIALLLPVAGYSNGTESRIKELKDAQFQKELAISDLLEMLCKKHDILDRLKSNACYYLTVLQGENESSKTESSIDQLIEDMETEFDNTKNINQMFKRGLLDQRNSELLRIELFTAALEKRFIKKLSIKYEIYVQELININKELTNLER